MKLYNIYRHVKTWEEIHESLTSLLKVIASLVLAMRLLRSSLRQGEWGSFKSTKSVRYTFAGTSQTYYCFQKPKISTITTLTLLQTSYCLELMMSSSLFMVQLKYLCQKGNVLHSLSRCCCNISILLSAGFLGVCWGLERKHKHIICRIKECLPPMGCVPIVKHKGNVIMNLNIHKAFRKKTLLHSEWAESHESASAWFIQCNPLFNLSKCSDVISFQNALCNVRDLLWCFKVLTLFTQAPSSVTWAQNYGAPWGNALRYTSIKRHKREGFLHYSLRMRGILHHPNWYNLR